MIYRDLTGNAMTRVTGRQIRRSAGL